MENKMMNAIYSMGNNIKNNVGIYSVAGLVAIASACGGPERKTNVEFDGKIGTAHVRAKKQVIIYEGKISSNYNIEKVIEDGTTIRYTDVENDGILNSVKISPSEGEKILKSEGFVFDEANKDYKHLRDTIAYLNGVGKNVSDRLNNNRDSALAKKYFGK
jgi:hypothetical protein